MSSNINHDGKHYKTGREMGQALLSAVDLMYQHNTAHRYLCGLTDILNAERLRRLRLIEANRKKT